MQKRTCLLIGFLLFQGYLLSQTTKNTLQDIRSKYSLIRENLASYEEIVEEIMDESTEGGHATAYVDETEIKLIEIAIYGEMGKQITAYYFDKEKLFFTFSQEFKYNAPIYLDKERAEEMGVSGHYDPEKTSIIENRYYFAEGKLIKYLDKDKKEVDLTIPKHNSQGDLLLEDARTQLAMFKKE